jgi:large subunit ribosomal protein L6
MSRIGMLPVEIPSGVTVEVAGRTVKAKGKFGELSVDVGRDVEVRREDHRIVVQPKGESLAARKMWGTARSLIRNMVNGVARGYTRRLEISGTGYRAQVQGKTLVLQLGFSHEVKYPIPPGISVQCPDQTHVVVHGADRQEVGQTAAEIRGFRPPEPYKGKGIKHEGEYILRKEGKKK